jgi:membrane-associated PAP2 superfamily phosphatase
MAPKASFSPAMQAVLALAVSALVILWLGNATDIDLRLADAVFDRARNVFPLQHAWFAERLNHELLKSVMTVLAVVVVGLALSDRWRPLRQLAPVHRLGLRVLASSAVLIPLVISLLKRASASHCPWDVQRYGGAQPYIRLLEWMPDGISAGHCLPGGHASSVLWLIALAAFWLPHRPRTAFKVGALMLIFSAVVGAIQQMRGAHFLTHTLWSMWIACALFFLIYQFHTKILAKSDSIDYSSVPRNAALTGTAE